MSSEDIKECLQICKKEFQSNFSKVTYEQTKLMSDTILNLTKALEIQLAIENSGYKTHGHV